MKRKMTYETFKEVYTDACRTGRDVLCVWWDDEGQQHDLGWHPYTRDCFNDLSEEVQEFIADGWEEESAWEEVLRAYADGIAECAEEAYGIYDAMVGEDDE